MLLKKAILKRIIDWIEFETDLGFGDVIPATEGSEDETGPRPDFPYIMVEIPSFHDTRGSAEPEEWYEDDGSGGIQKMTKGYYSGSVTLNSYGEGSADRLATLEVNTGSLDTLSIDPEGPINNLSAIGKRTNRVERHARDWSIRYGLLFEPDQDFVEFEKLKVTTDFEGTTGPLQDTFIAQ